MALGYGCLSLCGAEGTGEKAQNITVILMVGCQGSWVTLSGSRDGQGLVGSGQKELESEASGPALPLWLSLSLAVRFWMHHCPRPQLRASTYPSEKGDKHFAFGKVWELSETEGAPAVETDFREESFL